VHRLGLGDSRDWKQVYKGLTTALNAHIAPAVVFRLDPVVGSGPGRVVAPLTLQEALMCVWAKQQRQQRGGDGG
jgi:hypothetical protein